MLLHAQIHLSFWVDCLGADLDGAHVKDVAFATKHGASVTFSCEPGYVDADGSTCQAGSATLLCQGAFLAL